MRRSTSRSLFAVALIASSLLALRPNARVDRAVALLFSPSRLLGESCAPLRWLSSRSARSVQAQLVEREADERAARMRLHELQREATLPASANLRAGRRFVHAEVIERSSEQFDALVARVDGADASGLAPGMPVVHGDHYVGRVAELDAERPGFVRIELVTSRDFAVGARAEVVPDALAARNAGAAAAPAKEGASDPAAEGGGKDASVAANEALRFVVGGLAAHTRASDDLHLALSSPSRRDLPAAWALVDESLSELAPYSLESFGFRLGRIEATPRGEYVLAPGVELRSGLFRVAIVLPMSSSRPEGLAPVEPLFDSNWAAARVLTRSVGRREGFTIALGTLGGAREGAALVAGARLIGRVEKCGPLASSVSTLGDPGWILPAVALAPQSDRPIALGVLFGVGRSPARAGRIAVRWRSSGLEGFDVDELGVSVFTGSGQPGIPSGLWLGETRLPTTPGVHVLELDPGARLPALQRGFVRTRESADELTRERAP